MANGEQWVVDLDGVIWLGNQPIPGAAEALDRLRASGRGVAFFTNNSFSSRANLLEKFAKFGVACAPDELLSSAQAAALLCEKGERALCIGGEGIHEALREVGVQTTTAENAKQADRFDVVVVGFDPTFNFARLTVAVRAIHDGARLIGTNDDATYPMADGRVPGGGAILAAVSYASATKANIAGKPHDPAIELVKRRIGAVAVGVGDRPSTDGEFAVRLGAKFALVETGVTPPGQVDVTPAPELRAPSLAALVEQILATR